jgi:hypothetical protein
LTFSNVVATVALFVALGGGAYAAVGNPFVSISGSIQGCVKNGVLDVVKAGKRCPRHSTPLRFTQVGPRGKQGIQGIPGPKGDKGDHGPAGPLLSTLPSRSTLTGVYEVRIPIATSTSEAYSGVISFQFPLASTPTGVVVPSGASNPDPAHCAGSPANPTAAPGYFCLYEAAAFNEGTGYPHIEDPISLSTGAGSQGVRVGLISAASGSSSLTIGSWAVTAP